jgi:hypothetical protein
MLDSNVMHAMTFSFLLFVFVGVTFTLLELVNYIREKFFK